MCRVKQKKYVQSTGGGYSYISETPVTHGMEGGTYGYTAQKKERRKEKRVKTRNTCSTSYHQTHKKTPETHKTPGIFYPKDLKQRKQNV
jgi:hypothetical protein